MDIVQYAVNPESDLAFIPPRFQMNVTGPLFKGELQQPIDQADDMPVIGVRFADFTDLHQLFEILDIADGLLAIIRHGAKDGPADAVKFDQITF